jgi:hypothetical protein
MNEQIVPQPAKETDVSETLTRGATAATQLSESPWHGNAGVWVGMGQLND